MSTGKQKTDINKKVFDPADAVSWHDLISQQDLSRQGRSNFTATEIEHGKANEMSWNDLTAYATTLPHLEEIARKLIIDILGYEPPERIIVLYEPYLRGLVNLYFQNAINEEECLEQADEHIKLIRNADFIHHTCLTYDDSIYDQYRKTFVPYGEAVRKRLIFYLGYSPALEHSVSAELWLRSLLERNAWQMSDGLTPVDRRAISLIKYREVLVAHGLDAANASPLFQ